MPMLDNDWLLTQVRAGASPESLIHTLEQAGWSPQVAMDAVESSLREYLASHAREHALPEPVRVPAPVASNGASGIRAGDREVTVLMNLLHPRVVLFGGLLSDSECESLIEAGRARLRQSTTLNEDTGLDEANPARTSESAYFARGESSLIASLEARIAQLLDWPIDHGEALQVLRYGPGAQYEPHHDYFDVARPGTSATLARGGQRVASLVMYLNTPECGGATVFPESRLEVGAVRGNALFFSYDRPHPMTLSLHAGAPVIAGEKWVATKWLRLAPHR